MTSSRDLTEDNLSYRDRYPFLITMLIAIVVFILLLMLLILYQVLHRPLPLFFAVAPNGQRLELTASLEPNLRSDILIRWASKAAVTAYTFDFVNYNKQFGIARPYFTDSGWGDYIRSVSHLISNITENKLFVNGVVAGPPVISNQGKLPGKGYVWRIQIPFLVTYQSAEQLQRNNYTVVVSIVRVPTWINPAGIGIDQFYMA